MAEKWEEEFAKNFDFMISTEFDEVRRYITNLLAERKQIMNNIHQDVEEYKIERDTHICVGNRRFYKNNANKRILNIKCRNEIKKECTR